MGSQFHNDFDGPDIKTGYSPKIKEQDPWNDEHNKAELLDSNEIFDDHKAMMILGINDRNKHEIPTNSENDKTGILDFDTPVFGQEVSDSEVSPSSAEIITSLNFLFFVSSNEY